VLPAELSPGWLSANGGAAGHLLEVIRAEGGVSDLPVLADALEEAGCSDAYLLGHFRRGPHVGPCRLLQPRPLLPGESGYEFWF
jgi:hypothetical protein